MKTLDKIMSMVESLTPDEFLRLRKRMDELQRELWEAELTKTSEEFEREGITDGAVDRLVLKHRYDGLSSSQLSRLRKRIAQRRQDAWEQERDTVATKLREAKITDSSINELVVRRRRAKK
jgi:hypothetical protein